MSGNRTGNGQRFGALGTARPTYYTIGVIRSFGLYTHGQSCPRSHRFLLTGFIKM